jgi:hypothetical protein
MQAGANENMSAIPLKAELSGHVKDDRFRPSAVMDRGLRPVAALRTRSNSQRYSLDQAIYLRNSIQTRQHSSGERGRRRLLSILDA